MYTLADCQIVVACASDAAPMRDLADLLGRSGARVRGCNLGQELWTTLSDGAIDAVVVWLPTLDPDALALLDQVRSTARARGVLTCLLTSFTSAPRSAAARGAIMLDSSVDAAVLAQSISDLLAPVRALRELQDQQRALRVELQAAMDECGRLAENQAEVAHESRSMLGAIMGFASNLRDELPGPLTTDQRDHVDGILEAVERATSLLERSPKGPETRPSQVPQAVPRGQRLLIHLARLASEVLSLFDAVARRKGLAIRSELDETVCLWGDTLKLKQVVTNLVVNALRYTPAPGSIHVRVCWSTTSGADGVAARRHALIEVSDTGPGVPYQEREAIFERGYRAEATRNIKGDGIGLSVVKDIVSLHGGSISVGGEAGGGAVFSVLLPQDRRQRALDAATSQVERGERK
jgi:signal transduction histidine kinase